MKIVTYLFFLLLSAAPALTQTGMLKGVVTDESGGVVAGAKVALTSSSGQLRETVSNKEGFYSLSDVPFGDYVLEASASQLSLPEPATVRLSSGVQILNLQLKVAAMHEQVSVGDQTGAAVTTESAGNASAVVLRGKELEALGDDPEDLAADLQAMAGPSAGPNGGSFYIDGFSGGQIPSKNSILEVRINQNPFSPEYDALGYGRIEILTKPGADKFHGSLYNNFGDSFWNSRNPYAAEKAPFRLDEYGGSLEGPLGTRASFFVAADAAAIDNGAVINGTTLDPNTLAIIDPFTKVLSSHLINQTRFQVDRQTITSASDNLSAKIDVLNAFVGGGAQLGTSSN